jgi:hypothetical protein
MYVIMLFAHWPGRHGEIAMIAHIKRIRAIEAMNKLIIS